MKYPVFFSSILLAFNLNAAAATSQNIDQLRDQVSEFIKASLDADPSQTAGKQFEISVSSLDSRLRLSECDRPLAMSYVNSSAMSGNVSVKVICSGNKPWSMFVPAKINTFAEIATSKHALARGNVLAAGDVVFRRMNTNQAGAGYILDPRQFVGMELKRPLQIGETLRMSHLKPAQVVRKGERVVIESVTRGVSVVASGKALSNGELGQRIQVQNEQSMRVVDAKIVAPGKVLIAL
jgi:flagellar basal body P-ring formation protein FlgA